MNCRTFGFASIDASRVRQRTSRSGSHSYMHDALEGSRGAQGLAHACAHGQACIQGRRATRRASEGLQRGARAGPTSRGDLSLLWWHGTSRCPTPVSVHGVGMWYQRWYHTSIPASRHRRIYRCHPIYQYTESTYGTYSTSMHMYRCTVSTARSPLVDPSSCQPQPPPRSRSAPA